MCGRLEIPSYSGAMEDDPCYTSYVLRPGDALVLFGCLPDARYFSTQTNVYARWNVFDDVDEARLWFPEVAIIDPLNRETLRMSPRGVAAPYLASTVVVTTTDEHTYNDIAAA